MDNMVSYLAYESLGTRLENIIKKLCIIILIQLAVILALGIGIFVYSQQYTKETTTMIEAEQEGSEVNILGLGDINYGNAESQSDTDH